LPTREQRWVELEQRMTEPGFWDNQERAREIVGELKALKALVEPVRTAMGRMEDARALLDLAREADDADGFAELDKELGKLHEQVGRIESLALLSGKNDACDCFFSIQAGAGGT